MYEGGSTTAVLGVASLPFTGDSTMLHSISVAVIILGVIAILTGVVRSFAKRANRA